MQCPLCSENGAIWKGRVAKREWLYFCQECSATWSDASRIREDNYMEWSEYLKANRLPDATKLEEIDKNWE